MLQRHRTTTTTLALLACLAGTAGCGSQAGGGAAGSAAAAGRSVKDLVLVDCSGSFRREATGFVPDMVTIARNSARRRRTLWAGCFDGAPLRTLRWSIKVNFANVPPSATNSPGLAERVNAARASGLGRRFKYLITATPTRVAGSGLLEALELASQTPDVGRVFLFSDALSNEVDGTRLATATPAQLHATARRWSARLRGGLDGVTVSMVGVGLDAGSSVEIRNAERLFRELVAEAGGTLRWAQTLSDEQIASGVTANDGQEG